MNANRFKRLCESLVGAGLVPAERRAEVERVLRRAWAGDDGFAALSPEVDPESPAAGAGGHYAGALLLTDLAFGLSCLEELALRLEQTAARVRMMAAAGIDLADEQDDPAAVVVVADDPGTAKAFGLERHGEGESMVAL